MDRLWSPWRYSYVSSGKRPASCIFCDKGGAERDEENLVVYRAERNFILLNLYPYNNGHLLIAPYAHVPTLEESDAETLAEMMRLTQRAESVLRDLYRPQGMNIGMNIGECAGAGVAGHIHMHVLPRWPADVNFMTTVAETRLMPEDLGTSWSRISAAFREE